MQLLLVLALVFASFVALFALQNAQTVPIRFFSWAAETSVAVIALAAASLGAVSAVLAGLLRRFAIGFKLRQARGELARAERRLLELEKEREELERRLIAAQEGARPAPEGNEEAPGPEGKSPETGGEPKAQEDGGA